MLKERPAPTALILVLGLLTCLLLAVLPAIACDTPGRAHATAAGHAGARPLACGR